jgi:hypothetical protein
MTHFPNDARRLKRFYAIAPHLLRLADGPAEPHKCRDNARSVQPAYLCSSTLFIHFFINRHGSANSFR